MDFKLQDQVALVTGASRGLGKAIAFALAAEGCRLAIIARGCETLKETAEQLQLAGADVLAIPADVTVTADLERVVERTLTHYGHEAFYGQICYHLGWVDTQFAPVRQNMGKLLRPTLLLLAYEAAGAWELATTRVNTAHLHRALPAAAAIELFHNFTLMHDDIEDGDAERRLRPTAWMLWGIPQAINTGDGLYSLSRLTLFWLLDEGVEASLVAHLGRRFDRACLSVIEGQHLDLSFEDRQEISVSMYLQMITRKTAALMECAAEMGALLGTSDQQVIDRLRQFGLALGVAFQVRDDLLGIWATRTQSGKTPTGDLYRRKKTLPVLYALQQASPQGQAFLRTVYQQKEPLSPQQVAQMLEILEQTQSRAFCQRYLAEQCQRAHEVLVGMPHVPVPIAQQAFSDLEALLFYIREDIGTP